jgi:uncharacterized protein YbbC (DUF1343 family)
LVGAPRVDGVALADAVARASVAGVAVAPTEFTPSSSRYAGERCRGIALTVTDARALRPVRLGLAIALALRHHHADRWSVRGLDLLLGHAPSLEAIMRGVSLEAIDALGEADRQRFADRRARHLLY